MKISEAFRGAFFKAADLTKPLNLVIDSVEEEQVGDENKTVVHFKNADQAWVLNKTNAGTLAEAFGDDTDGWKGKSITLKPEKTQFNGKLVACIRAYPVADDVPY